MKVLGGYQFRKEINIMEVMSGAAARTGDLRRKREL